VYIGAKEDIAEFGRANIIFDSAAPTSSPDRFRRGIENPLK
jgi:hypothetical protein